MIPISLTAEQKLQALAYRFYQGAKWEPKPGDYYTSSRADLELYQVVDVRDEKVFTRYLVGSDVIAEWDASEFLAEHTFGRCRVFVPLWVLEASRAPVSQKEAAPVVTPRYGYSCYACRAMTPPAFDMEKAERLAAEANWQIGTDSAGQGHNACPDCAPGLFNVMPLRVYSAASPAPAVEPVGIKADDRLFNADEPMADGEIEMTAAENVLAWLIIEKIGVPDDRGYSPNEAQEILVRRLDYANELENESLRSALHPTPTPVSASVGMVEELIREAIDLLKEKKYGNPARSPGHNARLMLEDALAALRSPAVGGK